MFYKVEKKRSLFYSLILIIFLVILDQFTKVLAISNLRNKPDFIIIKNVFQLHYLENTGAAFSLLEGKMPLFIVLTPILVLILLYILVKMPLNKRYSALNFIILFVIAGAIGNYIDRVRFNYVVDFLYFSLIDFPVFNVADIYVTCSVILLIFLILFYYKDADFEDLQQYISIKKKEQ